VHLRSKVTQSNLMRFEASKVAAILSVVESCRRLKISVRDYLAAILPRARRSSDQAPPLTYSFDLGQLRSRKQFSQRITHFSVAKLRTVDFFSPLITRAINGGGACAASLIVPQRKAPGTRNDSFDPARPGKLGYHAILYHLWFCLIESCGVVR
jgi:hypothetical protein